MSKFVAHVRRFGFVVHVGRVVRVRLVVHVRIVVHARRFGFVVMSEGAGARHAGLVANARLAFFSSYTGILGDV